MRRWLRKRQALRFLPLDHTRGDHVMVCVLEGTSDPAPQYPAASFQSNPNPTQRRSGRLSESYAAKTFPPLAIDVGDERLEPTSGRALKERRERKPHGHIR